MKRQKRGLGWYVGMVFGDPVALADPDAPGMAPGGPWWTYVAMWMVIGLMLGVIPALLIWRIYWVVPDPAAPPPRGATDIFDGRYLGVEERLIEDRSVFHRCSGPAARPSPLTISSGMARIAGYLVQGEVSADGHIRIAAGGSLHSLQVDRQGTVRGQSETRYCTYYSVWKKE